MADKYDLAYISLDELNEVTSVPASNDFTVRYDDSAVTFVKVDASDLNATLGTTATATELNYLDIATLGTGAASKAVVLDASGDYTYPATGTIVYPSSAALSLSSGSTFNVAGTFQIGAVAMTATAAEINNACDVSTRIVVIADATNTLTLGATHVNRIAYVLDATLATTLPEATGSGDSYTVMQGIAATSSTIVTADTANCGYHGFLVGSDTDAAGTYSWTAVGTEDTITLNGVATGGKLGDWIRVTDIATDKWLIEGNIRQSGGSEATPFSSAA